jgi:hypothetical protein
MCLLSILIYGIILRSDGKYLHFSCDNVNVMGMNTLGLRALFAMNDKVCRLGALIQLRLGRTTGLSGQPDYRNSRLIGTAGLSEYGTCHFHLVTNILHAASKPLPKLLKIRQMSRDRGTRFAFVFLLRYINYRFLKLLYKSSIEFKLNIKFNNIGFKGNSS